MIADSKSEQACQFCRYGKVHQEPFHLGGYSTRLACVRHAPILVRVEPHGVNQMPAMTLASFPPAPGWCGDWEHQ